MKIREFFFVENQIEETAKAFLEAFPQDRIFFFKGNLGAGKTTFIKSLCKILGVHGELSSPTYSIVNEYSNELGDSIYHMDLYRIEHEDDLKKIGISEYLESGSYCFIEWPELIIPYFNGLICEITDEENYRKLAIFKLS